MSKPVIYVAHPVTGDPEGNCAKVLSWLRFLTEVDPTRVYIAPWVAEVLAHLNMTIKPEFYDRVISDDEDVVRHLDGVVVLNADPSKSLLKTSTGMSREVMANAFAGGDLFDFREFTDADAAREVFEDRYGGELKRGTQFVEDYLVRPKAAYTPTDAEMRELS